MNDKYVSLTEIFHSFRPEIHDNISLVFYLFGTSLGLSQHSLALGLNMMSMNWSSDQATLITSVNIVNSFIIITISHSHPPSLTVDLLHCSFITTDRYFN